MTLRTGHLSDLPSLYEICHRTGLWGQDASAAVSDRWLLGHYFAAPYLVRDPSWCWIAADEAGVAGYLVSTPDSRSFAQWMNQDWLPAVRALYPRGAETSWSPTERWIRDTIHQPSGVPDFVDEYPAHLHIDFLPRAQGQRLGSRSVALFVQKLKDEGVKGFHLGVGEANTAARAFYVKQGFELIRHDPGVLFYGLKV